jgi:hypothetical protein
MRISSADGDEFRDGVCAHGAGLEHCLWECQGKHEERGTRRNELPSGA